MKCVTACLAAVIFPLLAAAVSGTERDEARCRVPHALLRAGEVADAKAAYLALLKGDDTPVCAEEGLLQARQAGIAQSAQRCAAADALLHADFVDEAKTAYVAVLSADASIQPDCARAGLAAVRVKEKAKGPVAITRARALADYGLHEQARTLIQEQLAADAIKHVPADLQYLSGGKLPFWREIRRDLEPWARPLLEITAAVVLLILLVGLVVRRFAKPTLVIEEFDAAGLEDQSLAKDFSSIIRSHLNRMVAGSHGGHISLVTGPIQNIDIPAEVQAVVPPASVSWMSPLTWVRAIPALINWLSPPRAVSLAGRLHKAGAKGPGITVQLVERTCILSSYSFWRADFDDPSDPAAGDNTEQLQQLAEFAAIWLVFQLTQHYRSGLELLGTSGWRSYSYFRAGFLAETQGRDESAKQLYVRALQLDTRLHGARVNLAVWFIRHHNPGQALEQLARARDDCDKASAGDRDPTLYSAIYNLAVQSYKLSDVREAKAQTLDLLARIDGALDRIARKDKGYDDPALKQHLNAIRPVANVMLAGLLVELGEDGGLERIQAESEDASVSPRLQYNLGCAYSILAQHEPTDLAQAVQRREHYLDRSLRHLERAFQLSAGLLKQVQDDRSIAGVREARATQFQALLDTYGGRPVVVPEIEPELPLAEVASIGKQHAKALLAQNIRSRDELLLSSLDPAARHALATKLSVSEQLVKRWAHDMGLLRLVGIDPAQLKLLAMAEITHLRDLERRDPVALKALLDDLSTADGDIDPPQLAQVHAWINDACSNTRSKVV